MAKKIGEMRDLATGELEARLIDLRSDLARERALAASGTRQEKPAKTRNMRRAIARILTVMGEKKGKAAKAAGKAPKQEDKEKEKAKGKEKKEKR